MEHVDNWVMLWRLFNAVGAVAAVPVLLYIARRRVSDQPQSDLFISISLFTLSVVVGALYGIKTGRGFNPSFPFTSSALICVYVAGWRTRQRSRRGTGKADA